MSGEIKGLKEWSNWLDDASKKIETEVIRATETRAYQIEADSKRNTPVDTGRLRGSINTDIENGGLRALIGTNIDYAPFVELGTSRQPAQPFLFPAFEKYSAKYVEDLQKAVRKGLS